MKKYIPHATYGGLALFYLALVANKNYEMAQWVFIIILAFTILILLINLQSQIALGKSYERLFEAQRELILNKELTIDLLIDRAGLREEYELLKAVPLDSDGANVGAHE